MHIVIDANVFHGFFLEKVIGGVSSLTGSPLDIFNQIGKEDTAYLDEGGQIQNEWSSLVDAEWFSVWLARNLADGGIKIIPAELCRNTINALCGLGFPRGSRDIWYIRTAKAIVKRYNRDFKKGEPVTVLINEDLDFYEPYNKKRVTRERRIEIMQNREGSVARYLLRKERILVNCVKNYLTDYKA